MRAQAASSRGVFLQQDTEVTRDVTFLQLVNIALQKEPKQDKTLVEELNSLLWECLAKLVHETGFTSRKIALLSCS